MSSKICKNTSATLSLYFSKRNSFWKKSFRQRKRKKLKVKQKNVIIDNADVIILITGLMLKFLFKSKDVLYQVSLIWVKQTVFVSQTWFKPPPCLSKVKKSLPGIGLNTFRGWRLSWQTGSFLLTNDDLS